MLMNGIVFLAAISFWDSQQNGVAGAMTITLVAVVALVSHGSNRPQPIRNSGTYTMYDWYFHMCVLLTFSIAILNVNSAVTCGPPLKYSPKIAEDLKVFSSTLCELSWCGSRELDCRGAVALSCCWISLILYVFVWIRRKRMQLANAISQLSHCRHSSRQRLRKLRSSPPTSTFSGLPSGKGSGCKEDRY